MGGASNTNPGVAVNPDGLLDAILAAPDDDTPRLVYADWLTERGDPRGELILVQCIRARLQREGKRATAEYQRVYRREREILAQPGMRWAMVLVRGFRTHVVHEDPANLKKHWAEYRREPIETITLRDARIADIAWIVRQQADDRIPLQAIGVQTRTGSLALDPHELGHLAEDDDALVWPFEAPPSDALRRAIRRIHFNAPGDAVAAFARDPAPNVVEISFMGGSVAVAKALATALPNVQKLSGWLEPAVALEFLEVLKSPKLTNFALQGYQKKTFDAEGGRRIAASAILPQLTNLIADVPLDPVLAVALAERATNLVVLSPGGVDYHGLRAFAKSSLPARLRWLKLRNNVAGATLVPFATVDLGRLESLTLEGFPIDNDAAQAFANNTSLTKLVDLKLVACPLKPSAARILVESPYLDALIEPKFIACRLWSEATEILKARWPDAVFQQD